MINLLTIDCIYAIYFQTCYNTPLNYSLFNKYDVRTHIMLSNVFYHICIVML